MPHELRVAIIMAVALTAFFGLSRYLLSHLSRAFGFRLERKRYVAAFLALVGACAVLPRFFPRTVGGAAPALGMFAALVVLGLLITCALLVPYEVLRLVFGALTRRGLRAGVPPPSEAPADPSRRAFVHQAAVGGALSLGVGATAYGTLIGRHDYTLETVPIRLAKLPPALSGFSIVQLSDLHVGSFVGDYEFRRGLELVRRARPDLIVLTGDLIDHDIRYLPQLGRFVRALGELAPRGVQAVLGNHDHYTGAESVARTLGQAGANVLVNRHVRIADGAHGFVLAGVDDVIGQPDVQRAFAGAPPELARILLSHNPGYFPTAHTHADLTLSGHTHGGQITMFINPAELLLRHGLVRGHYLRDHSQIYVNRGFGTAGPPTRVGSPPEITKLVLTA